MGCEVMYDNNNNFPFDNMTSVEEGLINLEKRRGGFLSNDCIVSDPKCRMIIIKRWDENGEMY